MSFQSNNVTPIYKVLITLKYPTIQHTPMSLITIHHSNLYTQEFTNKVKEK